MDRQEDDDEAQSEERQNKAGKPQQPGPPKKAGDHSPNPLPDAPSEHGREGGDPGRV